MNFDLTDDQLALRDGFRALLEGKFPMSRVRKGFDQSVYDDLAEAGVFSLRADGFEWDDAAIVFEELGRALVPGPLVWTHLAHDIAGIPQGIPVGGTERRVPWPLVPDFGDVLVILRDDAVTVTEVDGVLGTPVPWPLDPLTPVWRIERVRGEAQVGDADAVAWWWRAGALLTASYLVGMADACSELATAYAKEREQFGRPIGSFQAVKHLCADMAVRAEVARAASHAAACALNDPAGAGAGAAVDRAVSGAKCLAGEAAVLNGKSAMQVLGGMGFTWEVDVHLYLKRAWVLDTVFGSAGAHADAVATLLQDAPGS